MKQSVKNKTSAQLSSKSNEIINAARKRFAHYGFSKVSMDEIAADADMGKASLYYYFPTKENLFQAVLIQEQNEFLKEMEILLNSDNSASEKLIEFVNKRLAFFQHSLNLGTLGLHTFFDAKSFHKKYFQAFEKQELILIKRIISEGKVKGEFDKKLNQNTEIVLLHILQGLRIRTLKLLISSKEDIESMRALQSEMNLAIKIFIKGISN